MKRQRARVMPKVYRKVWFHKVFHRKTLDEDEMNSESKRLEPAKSKLL